MGAEPRVRRGFVLLGVSMLNLFLTLVKKTRRMVRFEARNPEDGFLYIPKQAWEAMERPEYVVVEITPDEESTDEGHYQDA